MFLIFQLVVKKNEKYSKLKINSDK